MKTKISVVSKIVLLIFFSQNVWCQQEDQRYKEAAKIQKILNALSTTKVAKVASIRELLLLVNEDDRSIQDIIKETADGDLTDILGLTKMVTTGQVTDDGEAITKMEEDLEMIRSNVLDPYFSKYEEAVGTRIPYEPISLKKFVSLLADNTTLRELIAGTLYRDKIWIAELQFNSAILKVSKNLLKNLESLTKNVASDNNSLSKELKEAFMLFTSNFLKEDVEKVMDQFADQIFLFGAGSLGRWIKKDEIKTNLIKEFHDEPYSAISVENFVHTNLFFISKVKDLPKTEDPRKLRQDDSAWWPGISADWSAFQDSDYFVAAPSMIGMIGDESLGAGSVECYVFRKIGGRWRVVGM